MYIELKKKPFKYFEKYQDIKIHSTNHRTIEILLPQDYKNGAFPLALSIEKNILKLSNCPFSMFF